MPRPLTIVGGRSKKAVSPIWIYTGLVIAVFVVYYRLTDFGASDRRKIYFQGQTGGNSITNGDQCLLPQGNWANTCEESLVIEGPCQGHCLLKATCEQHAGSSVQTSFEYPAGVMLEIKNINGVLCQKVGEVTNCGLNYHRSLQTCPQGVIPMRTIENSHWKGKKFEQDFGDDMDNLISSDEDNGKKKSKFDDDEWEAYFAANKHRSLDDDERPKKAHKDFLPDDFEGNDYGEQHRKKSKRGHHEDDDSSESSESGFGSNRDNHKYRQMATEDDERERKYRQMSNDDDRSARERDHGRERGQRGTDRTRDRDYEHEARDKDWQRDDDSNRDRDYDRDYERRDRDRNRDHDRNYDRDLDHHDRDRDHDEEEPHRRGVIEHDRDHESGGRKGKHAESDEDDDGGDWRRKRHRDEEDRDKHLRGWNDRNRY